jgi:hypothetical protein
MVDLLLYQFTIMAWNTGDAEWWKKWHRVSLNTNDRVVSYFISTKPDMIPIFFPLFWKNSNDKMVLYLWEHYQYRVNWTFFSKNTSDVAVDLLLSHINSVDWESVNENPHPRLVTFLLSHPEYIQESFNKNKDPRALSYLLSHPNRINWDYLSSHPDLFKENKSETRKDIIQFTKQLL